MPYSINRTVPPAADVVSLDTVKAHLRITHDAEDDYLESFVIAPAIRIAERECGLSFVSSTFRLVLDAFPRQSNGFDYAGNIDLPVGPVSAVSSIQYRDTAEVWQTIDSDEYWSATSTGRVVPVVSWPSTSAGPEAVRITFVAGWATAADVPADAVSAVLLICADLYANRGDGKSTTGDAPGTPINPAAKRLLSNLANAEW